MSTRLADHTWFGLGGPARELVRPQGVSELRDELRRCRESNLPVRILGRGANVLVADAGFDGVVIQLCAPEFESVSTQGTLVLAGAGADMPKLILRTTRQGLGGLEVLGGIPGTVGGCIRMNAGGKFGEIGDLVRRVRVIDGHGQDCWLDHQQVGFTYRHTRLAGLVVVEAEFALMRAAPEALRRKLLEVWKYKQESQPLADHSAGCIFRNPPDDSAGRLIDASGLKGMRCGRARVSEQHANFIVADKGATAAEVIELIRRVREKVYQTYEVRLETEIDIWGDREQDTGIGGILS